MSKLKEKIFVSVVSNIAIFLVVLAVFAVSFSGRLTTVINASSEKPYYHGDQSKARASLMINVYWGTEYLDNMLNILNEYGVKCTFFVGGSWAQSNPQTLIKIQSQGHEIANHGHFHKDHKNLTAEKNRQEIAVCDSTVQKITGVKMNLFAPPSGSFSDTTLKVAQELGYRTIMWTRDTIDWRDKDSNLVYKRAIKNLKNGDLILMHPTAHTAAALPNILKYFKENGFTAVTVTENIGK